MGRGETMEPALEIKMVRETLALAVGLWAAAKKGLITPLHLPAGRVVLSVDAGQSVEATNTLGLKGQQDLIRCVANQARGAFAFSVLQTHRTLESLSATPPLQESDPDHRSARCTVHLLNDSLGRDMLMPAWVCPPEYRRRFEIKPIHFVLDASNLNGKPLFWDDFGGLDRFLALLDYCADWAERGLPRTVRNQVGVARRLPGLEDQSKPGTAGAGLLNEFIETRCVAGPEAQTTAADLYAAYRAWCRESGREPMAQRSFGMRLTALGFHRRRRARGRHWWQGIQVV